jgi:hypothetical protein
VSVEERLRRLILALLSFGLVALGTELIAMGHYEDAWQMVPVGLLGVSILTILAYVIGRGTRALAVLQVLMILMIASGLMGIFLHYQANVSFQLDTNPDLSEWELFTRVLHAIAPPAMAPGVMAQLGFLGLIYTYKHPARRGAVS